MRRQRLLQAGLLKKAFCLAWATTAWVAGPAASAGPACLSGRDLAAAFSRFSPWLIAGIGGGRQAVSYALDAFMDWMRSRTSTCAAAVPYPLIHASRSAASSCSSVLAKHSKRHSSDQLSTWRPSWRIRGVPRGSGWGVCDSVQFGKSGKFSACGRPAPPAALCSACTTCRSVAGLPVCAWPAPPACLRWRFGGAGGAPNMSLTSGPAPAAAMLLQPLVEPARSRGT